MDNKEHKIKDDALRQIYAEVCDEWKRRIMVAVPTFEVTKEDITGRYGFLGGHGDCGIHRGGVLGEEWNLFIPNGTTWECGRFKYTVEDGALLRRVKND